MLRQPAIVQWVTPNMTSPLLRRIRPHRRQWNVIFTSINATFGGRSAFAIAVPVSGLCVSTGLACHPPRAARRRNHSHTGPIPRPRLIAVSVALSFA